MDNKRKLVFTLITIVIGFMLAIQFQTTQEPVVRDTRDIWQLRNDLQKEQELQSKLLDEIRQLDEVTKEYVGSTQTSKIQSLKEQKEELQRKVGLTQLSGSGIVLTVDILFDDLLIGEPIKTVPPELLSRLINEVSRYGAEAISIADQRIISTSPIRDVNNMTYVNNSPIPPLPVKIKVIAENAKELHNRMVVSQSIDEFAIEGLEITSELSDEIKLPAYNEPLRIRFIEPVEDVTIEKEKG